jgi:hypothetical protein
MKEKRLHERLWNFGLLPTNIVKFCKEILIPPPRPMAVTITDTATSQNIDLSSRITLYLRKFEVGYVSK